MTDSRARPPDASDDLEPALERGLRRQPLDAEAFARMRAALSPEFNALRERARRRRLAMWSALAAGVAALCIGYLMLTPASPQPIVARIQRTAGAGLAVRTGLLRLQTLTESADLHAGERWAADSPVLLSLASGVTMRLAPGAVIDATRADEMSLRKGRVYLDFGPNTLPFTLRTPTASIRHIGTQFEAAVVGGATRVRVREGLVRVFSQQSTDHAERGTEIVLPANGPVVRRPVPTYGKDWEWVESIAPTYEIDNKSLMDFLLWVGRETGRHVDFADAHVRDAASQIVLHGSVDGLPPLEALDRVLRTTSLRFELQGDAIRVSSRR